MKPYNEKKFLDDDNPKSSSIYSVRIDEGNRNWWFRIHDCNDGVLLHGDLNNEQEYLEGIKRLTTLRDGLINFIEHLKSESIEKKQEDDNEIEQILSTHFGKTICLKDVETFLTKQTI